MAVAISFLWLASSASPCTVVLGSGWNRDNIRVVIFVQSDTGEILQGLEVPLPSS